VFLDTALQRNPALITTAVCLHREARLPSNCYVIDLDTVTANATLLKDRARSLGLRWYFMSKQFGRDPTVLRAIIDPGSRQVVAVEAQEARQLHAQRIPIGHVGHLGQVPFADMAAVLAMEPEVMTVFGSAQAAVAGKALGPGKSQAVLLRVWAEGDIFFPLHRGGIPEHDVLHAAEAIQAVPGIRVAGVTSFPCLSYSGAGRPRLTTNMVTIMRSAERLRQSGFEIEQINAPGNTSVEAMEAVARAGATHVEPGHALTGTTVWHAVEELPERPAMIYLSEVAHLHNGRAFVLGGGLYLDQVTPPEQPTRCLFGTSAEALLQHRGRLEQGADLRGIDYYGVVVPEDGQVQVGDSVVFAFRAQVFATRAYVALLAGLESRRPWVVSVLDRSLRPVPGFPPDPPRP